MKSKGLFLLAFLSVNSPVFAYEQGKVTSSLMSIFSGVGSVFSGICMLVGLGFIFASFTQYREHRKNKLLVPISKPIMWLILGIVLVCVPILGHYTTGGQLISTK